MPFLILENFFFSKFLAVQIYGFFFNEQFNCQKIEIKNNGFHCNKTLHLVTNETNNLKTLVKWKKINQKPESMP